jgi:hypothetical protein
MIGPVASGLVGRGPWPVRSSAGRPGSRDALARAVPPRGSVRGRWSSPRASEARPGGFANLGAGRSGSASEGADGNTPPGAEGRDSAAGRGMSAAGAASRARGDSVGRTPAAVLAPSASLAPSAVRARSGTGAASGTPAVAGTDSPSARGWIVASGARGMCETTISPTPAFSARAAAAIQGQSRRDRRGPGDGRARSAGRSRASCRSWSAFLRASRM